MKKLKKWQIVLLVIFYPVGIIYLIVWLNNRSKNTAYLPPINKSASVAPVAVSAVPEKKTIPDGELNYNMLFDIEEEAVLRYEYEENLCLIDGAIESVKGNGGKKIHFKQEPENEHDNKAVAVYLGRKKIGYVYRGLVQDMCNDYLKREWPVIGHINKYSVDKNKTTYKIGFYKPLDLFENKAFKLIKTNSKIDEYTNRQDCLESCDEGDMVDIDYNAFDDSYIVSNDEGEIGELPKSGVNFINESEPEKVIGKIDEIIDDEKLSARVIVYLIK